MDFTISDKILNLSKGWFVVYTDGTVITESEKNWTDISKKNIKTLALKWYKKYWSVSGKDAYVCFKKGTVFLAPGGGTSPIECLERCIGYYDKDGNKVIYRVNEATGQMRLDIIDTHTK